MMKKKSGEKGMLSPVIELEKILIEEKRLYEEVYSIEYEKSESIIARDGKTLEKLSIKQESLIFEITNLEDKRKKEIERYIHLNKIRDFKSDASLKEIVQSMDEDSSSHLLRIGLELKNTILKITEKQKLNSSMTADNLEFFNMLLSGLRTGSSLDAGYGMNGKEDARSIRPLIFNKTA